MPVRPKKISYGGFDYTIKDSTTNNHRYRCSLFRSRSCKATLRIRCCDGAYVLSQENHTCSTEVRQNPQVIDVTEEMLRLARDYAVNRRNESARKLWDGIIVEMDEKHSCDDVALVKASRERIRNLIHNTRRDAGEGCALHEIEADKHGCMSESDGRRFLRFVFAYPSMEGARPPQRRMLFFANPDLLPMLKRRKVATDIDGTFRCTPKPFTQLLILAIYDDETELYVPIIY